MKILLINPPQVSYPGSYDIHTGLPLGLAYIGVILEKSDYKVEILDCLVADFSTRKIGDACYYGMSWKNIKKDIERRKPDIVGITAPYTAQIENTIKVAEIVKEIDSEVLTIVGGAPVSALPIDFLKVAKRVDIAVIGEGEYTILDIMKFYEGKCDIDEINGIGYRKGVNIKLTKKREFIKNLDELPFPAYHLFDMEKYFKQERRYRGIYKLRELPIITSRGCPFNCIFCSIHLHMGKGWRKHSAQYVIEHIEYVVNKYHIGYIHFEDDNFIMSKKRCDSILDGLIDRGIKISWDTPNGIRADGLNRGLLKKMKKSGCKGLSIGVESGDQYILDNVIHKNLRLEKVIEAAKLCKELSIPLNAFFVIGFPGEKKHNMKNTIDFMIKLQKSFNARPELMIATPLHGTRLYEICKNNGYLTQELTPRAISEGPQYYGTSLIKTEDFSPEDVKEIAKRAYISFYRQNLCSMLKNPILYIKKIYHNPILLTRFIKLILEGDHGKMYL